MTNILCFSLLLLWPIPLALALWSLAGRAKGRKTAWWGLLSAVFALGYPAVLALNLFWDGLWPYRLEEPSPTGEYVLEQRYTDFLTPGYRCRTYLVAGGRRYRVSDAGPGGAAWLSEDTFGVEYREYRWKNIYSVADWIEGEA